MQTGVFTAGTSGSSTPGISFGSKPTGNSLPTSTGFGGGFGFGTGFGAKSSAGFGTFGGSAQQSNNQGEMARIINAFSANMFATVLEKAYLSAEPDTCLFKTRFKSAGPKIDKPPTSTPTISSFGAKPSGFGGSGGFGLQQKPLQSKTDPNEVVGLDGLLARANIHNTKLQEMNESITSTGKYNFKSRLDNISMQASVISSLMSQCNSVYAAISFKLMKIIEERGYGCSDQLRKKALFGAASQLAAAVENVSAQFTELTSSRSSFRDFSNLWMTLDNRVIADLRAFISQELAFLGDLCTRLKKKNLNTLAASSHNFSVSNLT